jgi:hypothetical protein
MSSGCARASVRAIESGACELSELEFSAGSNGVLTGDLHIARIENPQGHDLQFHLCPD